MLSSNTLIHPATTVYDFNYTVATKTDLLQRIQYWKDYLTERNIKSVNLLCYQGITQTAIMFACLEKSITIDVTDHEVCTATADLAILGYSKKHYHNPHDHKSLLIADNLQVGYHGNPYTEESINTDFIFIIKGSQQYTAGEFIYAGQLGAPLFSVGQNIATIQHLSNLETSAVWLLSPVIAGTNIYACAHMIDLTSLTYKGIVDKIGLYPMHLSGLYHSERGVNNNAPFGTSAFSYEFNGVELITIGNLPSPAIMDWAIARGVSKISSLFASGITPLFIKHYNTNNPNYFLRELGTPLVNCQLNSQNELLFKYVDNANVVWHNTKSVVNVDDGKMILKGTEQINGMFLTDIQDFIFGFLMDTKIGPVDFALSVDNRSLTVSSFTQYVHDAILEVSHTLTKELINFCNVANVKYQYIDKSEKFKI